MLRVYCDRAFVLLFLCALFRLKQSAHPEDGQRWAARGHLVRYLPKLALETSAKDYGPAATHRKCFILLLSGLPMFPNALESM